MSNNTNSFDSLVPSLGDVFFVNEGDSSSLDASPKAIAQRIDAMFSAYEETTHQGNVSDDLTFGNKGIFSHQEDGHSFWDFLERSEKKGLVKNISKGELTSSYPSMDVALISSRNALLVVGGTFAIESAAIFNLHVQLAYYSRISGKPANVQALVADYPKLESRAYSVYYAAVQMYESKNSLGAADKSMMPCHGPLFGIVWPGDDQWTEKDLEQWRNDWKQASREERKEMIIAKLKKCYSTTTEVYDVIAHCYLLTKRASEMENPDTMEPFDAEDDFDIMAAAAGFFRRSAQGLDVARQYEVGAANRFAEMLTETHTYRLDEEGNKVYEGDEGFDDLETNDQTEVVVLPRLLQLLTGGKAETTADGKQFINKSLTPFGEHFSNLLKLSSLRHKLLDNILDRAAECAADTSGQTSKAFREQGLATKVQARGKRRILGSKDVVR